MHDGSSSIDTDALDVEEQKSIILGILCDFLEGDDLPAYVEHVGFDIGSITDVRELPQAWLGHYRIRKGVYDVERACNDLSEFPPIASAIVRELNKKRKLTK